MWKLWSLLDRTIQTVFSVGQYKSIDQWLRRVSVSRATLVQIQQDAETLCCSLAICVSLSLHWYLHFKIAALSINFLLCQWKSSTDRVLTLNMYICCLLLWSTWGRGQDLTLAACAGLEHGPVGNHDLKAVSEVCSQHPRSHYKGATGLKRLGHWFSLNCRKYLKNIRSHWGFCTLHLEGWDMLYNIHFMLHTTFVT